MDDKRETASLEPTSHVDYLAQWVDCAFLGRPNNCDCSIYRLLCLKAELKLLLELGQVDTCAMVDCDADHILRSNPSNGYNNQP